MNEMKAYRIVEIKNGRVLSLFHGTRRSRVLPWDEWIKADQKQVSDGSSSYSYQSGFHFLLSEEQAQNFFNKRFRNKEDRYVVPCHVRGNIRIKNENIKPSCYLADEIMFSKDEIMGNLIGGFTAE